MRWLLPCLFALCSLRAFAEDAPAKRPAQVSAECLMVTLPEKAALALLPALNDEGKVEAACATLLQMVDRKEATLVANLILNGRAGLKQTAESVQEFKYPTEFEPPQFPDVLPKEHEEEFLKNWPLIGITPTSFETRNVGSTLELEPTVSADGRWISANVIVQHLRFLRFLKYDGGVRPNGEHLWVEMPEFSSLKNITSVDLLSGQRLLIGVHKLTDPENTLELFLLRLTAKP